MSNVFIRLNNLNQKVEIARAVAEHLPEGFLQALEATRDKESINLVQAHQTLNGDEGMVLYSAVLRNSLLEMSTSGDTEVAAAATALHELLESRGVAPILGEVESSEKEYWNNAASILEPEINQYLLMKKQKEEVEKDKEIARS